MKRIEKASSKEELLSLMEDAAARPMCREEAFLTLCIAEHTIRSLRLEYNLQLESLIAVLREKSARIVFTGIV